MTHRDPRELVFFAFGATGRAELPARALVAVLEELGLEPSGARSLLTRMERSGALTGRRSGRRVHYAPAGSSAHGFDRLRDRHSHHAGGWSGAFHAVFFAVPEEQRSFRDQLRRRSRSLGFGTLRPGVLIHPDDIADLLGLDDAPPGSRTYSGQLVMGLQDARAAALEAWSLSELADRHRAQAAACRTAASQATGVPDDQALRSLAAGILPAMSVLLDSPTLPVELLPDDWPHEDLSAAIDVAVEAHASSVSARLEQLLGES